MSEDEVKVVDKVHKLPGEPAPAGSSMTAHSPSALSTALLTGKALFLLQLLSRALTFILNQALVRLSTPEVFGTASIQFDLISSTILFLSREGVRNALLRRQDPDAKQRTGSDPLSNIPFYAGWAIASVVVGVYLSTSSTITTSQLHFHPALGLYVLAALVELSIEPLYVRSLVSTPPKINVRVQAEGSQAIAKAVVTFICLFVSPQTALLGFAIGQLGGALTLAARYIAEYGLGDLPGFSTFYPSEPAPPTDAETKSLALANARQSLVKHVLTEADRIAVGRISPLSEQGGYAIAMNYGSLIARILFQPIEETLHLHFSSQHKANSTSTSSLLEIVVRLSAHLLIFLPTFVPPALPLILHVLLPKHYKATSAPKTLETYLSFYIPLLSLNGILEAFHTATATPAQMGVQARWMILSSVAFVGALFILRNYLANEQALVVSNCISMVVRIFYAFRHAQQVAGIPALTLLPHPLMFVALAGPGTFLRSVKDSSGWESSWPRWTGHMAWTAVCGLTMLGIMLRLEQRRLGKLKASLERK